MNNRSPATGSAATIPPTFFATFAGKLLAEAPLTTRSEFRYVGADRAPHYRCIMRCFLEAYESFYQDELTAEQVFQALGSWDPDYTLDRCKADLEALGDWGNLVKALDMGDGQLTLATLTNPATIYRATGEALEIERFLEDLGRRVEAEGALRHEDLLLLAESFARLDALLNRMLDRPLDRPLAHPIEADEPAGTQRREVAAIWRQTSELFERIKREARGFVSTLREATRAAATDVSAYVAYRDAVTLYVDAFEHDLERVSRRIREYFRSWAEQGLELRLIEAVAEHLEGPTLKPRPPEELHEAARGQVGRFKHWFASRSNADSFSRAARDAVYTVILRAKLLIAMSRLQGSYLSDLDALARLVLDLPTAEAAAHLVAVAFQLGQVPLMPQHLAEADDAVDPWADDRPALDVGLMDVDRRRTGGLIPPEPVVRDIHRRAERARQLLAERQAEGDLLLRLFAFDGERSVHQVLLDQPGDCEHLLQVYRACREDPRGEQELPDGSTVSVRPAAGRELVAFGCAGHTHWAPPFRFHRATGRQDRQQEALDGFGGHPQAPARKGSALPGPSGKQRELSAIYQVADAGSEVADAGA
ncbi:MAG: DUF2397 family protein [Chloroflexi bacterium]|nr:DUF2397 family protein [Chloroflexota bacterium]